MDNVSQRIANLSPAKRALLELRLNRRGSDLTQITPRPAGLTARVSFAQQRLWFLQQLERDATTYNVPRAFRLKGSLDLLALKQSLEEIVVRHESLRTHFALSDGALVQVIETASALLLPLIDLTNLPIDERETTARDLASEEAERPFDLACGPMFRSTLLRLAANEHLLLLTLHHIVSDAWSAGIFFRELGALYRTYSRGEQSPLLPLTIQYADFAEWQREWLRGDVLDQQLSYWRTQLADAPPVLDLPTDFSRPAVQSFRGSYETLTLPHELSKQLREISRQAGATLFMTLLAGFKTLLWRYTGQDDLVVGTAIAGRNRAEVEELIGFFVNTLALRTKISGSLTFRELLEREKETALGAYAHQDLPFEKLVQELQPERDLGRNPLFQVMFELQNAPHSTLSLPKLTLTSEHVQHKTAKFDLFLVASDNEDELQLFLEYSTELFRPDTIVRMLRHYRVLLESMVNNQEQPLSTLALMTGPELQHLLKDASGPLSESHRDKSIHEIFEHTVEQTPDRVAIISGDERLSYLELNESANRLAHYLLERGAKSEAPIGIYLKRSIDMIVSLLAVLKAGCVYVPVDTTHPPERVSFILRDSGARMLLTHKGVSPPVIADQCQIICLDIDRGEIQKKSISNPQCNITSRNAAHVIYTSGSTGKPKGVISPHLASINRFEWMWHAYPFSPDEVCCQKTALSFVDSIWEIFGPLLRGITLVVLSDEVVKEPRRFLQALEINRITRMVLVPSLLRVLLDQLKEGDGPTSLKYCVCSGETLPLELAQEFRKKLPDCVLINLYGSSEVAADVSVYRVESTQQLGNIPIGRPISNMQVYILDAELAPAPVGVPGELYVGGEGLAYGYLNHPELTAERFIPNPFAAEKGSRLYKTGDIGRVLFDGNIEYRGRRDHQVKIRGFRIELGEIEAVLASHPNIRESIVMAHDFAGEKRLTAYLIANGKPPEPESLRRYLRQKLPEYMLPSAFVTLDHFPLTASGKINRLALPPPDQEHFRGTRYVEPRTVTEEIIASIWSHLLGIESVGRNDDFFALGGHSLLLATVMARLCEVLRVEIPMRVLFEFPTLSALAERLERLQREVDVEQPALVAVERTSDLPLTFAQERLWFVDQLESGSAAYNIPRAIKLTGRLDVYSLRAALETIVSRHEVLRTTFPTTDGKPRQIIAVAGTVHLPVFDLTEIAGVGREVEAKRIISHKIQRSFDLARGPLIFVALLKLAADQQILLLIMHHIISDGWSIGIFLDELFESYNELQKGSRAQLPSLSIQYADYAFWQRQMLKGDRLESQLNYWRQQLAGAPAVIAMPTDKPRPAIRSFCGARHTLRISEETTAGLRRTCRAEQVTLFMALLATFQTLLWWYSRIEDIVVGSPASGRLVKETESLIGYFVNTLVLRTSLSGDPEFREIMRRVREVALGAFAHQDVPFDKIVEELRPERSLSYNPLFQIWFVLQNGWKSTTGFEGLGHEPFEIENKLTRHDLQLTLWENAAALEGSFTYSADLFVPETIEGMAEQYEALLGVIVARPHIRLTELRVVLDKSMEQQKLRRIQQLEESSRQKLKTVRRRSVN